MVDSKSVVLGVFVLLLFVSPAFAQLDTGTISGTVADQTGAAVPGASVAGTTNWATSSQLVFTPASNLAANTWFGIKLTAGSSGAADLAGNIQDFRPLSEAASD